MEKTRTPRRNPMCAEMPAVMVMAKMRNTWTPTVSLMLGAMKDSPALIRVCVCVCVCMCVCVCVCWRYEGRSCIDLPSV